MSRVLVSALWALEVACIAQAPIAGNGFYGRSEGSVPFTDKLLRCRDCGIDFLFTIGEQEFYATKGLMNEPVRCFNCRAQRRAQRESGGAVSDASPVGARPRREMHPAVCAQCGEKTLVPFLPRGDRPLYCSSCFERVRSQ